MRYFICLIILTLLFTACKPTNTCDLNAGYTWCEDKQKCIRQKEEPCELSFVDCVEQGNPIMESYPRQCKYYDKTFVEETIQEIIEE